MTISFGTLKENTSPLNFERLIDSTCPMVMKIFVAINETFLTLRTLAVLKADIHASTSNSPYNKIKLSSNY